MAMRNDPDPGPILNDIRRPAAARPGRNQPATAGAETSDTGAGNA